MATERNVVDFKIHNLTEEQFQELKVQGKIDPNAVYCTPDTTKERLDALEENKQDVATAVNYDNITNCITEIPQDIKVEISDGQFVIKAGSRVYMPNGSGVFDTIVIPNDIKVSGWTNLQGMVFVSYNGLTGFFTGIAQIQSGSSGTISGGNVWYDTTTNKIFRSSGSAWDTQVSFPICFVSCSNGDITSINQVFNGLGYIGSTVFVLPGVKGLVSEGFNSDGTLKNTITTTSFVKTIEVSSSGYVALTPYDSNRLVTRSNYYIVNNQSEMNSLNVAGFYYVKQENKCYSWSGGGGTKYYEYIPCIKISYYGGKITAFSKDLSFRAVDYNDTEYMAHQSMPSSRYVDLTLPESGGTITAPADGWLILIKTSGAANEYASISARVSALQVAYGPGTDLTLSVPVSKSETVRFYYTATRDTKRFRFIYANGAK